jgi:ADP-ribose pyrophosphatase YjhB (NUDIX family)
MLAPDIHWNTEHGHFNYRIAGVCVERGHVLLDQLAGTSVWFVPGGVCQLMESAPDALAREMREELDVAVRVERLLWIIEHVFVLDGQPWHEVGLYFRMRLPATFADRDPDQPFLRPALERASSDIFRWFPTADLERVHLFPTVLRTALRRLPRTPRYLIERCEADTSDPPTLPEEAIGFCNTLLACDLTPHALTTDCQLFVTGGSVNRAGVLRGP